MWIWPYDLAGQGVVVVHFLAGAAKKTCFHQLGNGETDSGRSVQTPMRQHVGAKDSEALPSGAPQSAHDMRGSKVWAFAGHGTAHGKTVDDGKQHSQSVRLEPVLAGEGQQEGFVFLHQRLKFSAGLVPDWISNVFVWLCTPLLTVTFWAPVGRSTMVGVFPTVLPAYWISAPEGELEM